MTAHSQSDQSSSRRPPQPPNYPPYPYSAPADDEIDLRELWNVIWQGKWLIVAITTIFAVASVVLALSLPNIYRSEALLAPSDEAQGGGISQMAGQLGGLASLAGINLSAGGGDNKVAVAMEVIRSRKFVADFVERHGILPELMAVEGWNSSTNQLVFDRDLYDAETETWVREVDSPKEPKPSAWEAYKAFMETLAVSQDEATGFVTIAVEHQSPVIAARWVSLLVNDVNAVMKEQDVGEAKRSIDYLTKQLDQIAVAEMRAVFYQLIEEQTKTIMLAEVRDEYIFSTIDPPVIAEEKSKPKRALICILGVLLGGMLAIMVVFIRHFIRGGDSGRNSRDQQ